MDASCPECRKDDESTLRGKQKGIGNFFLVTTFRQVSLVPEIGSYRGRTVDRWGICSING